MNFQIAKLIIWPKNNIYPPRTVEFQLGKLNVITGLSRTGKSAIIPIIDYCLGSNECNIPIDIIRDAAAWYGIIIQLAEDQMLVCRRVPNGSNGSPEFYFQRGKIISVPLVIEARNDTQDGVKQMLNTISAMPYLPLEVTEDKNGFKGPLSFRDLMAFVFQPQDTVANQNIFFYKTHSHIHREKLRNWFPYILGAETSEVLFARQQLDQVEKSLRAVIRDFERIKSVASSWMNNLKSHMKVAREYGLHNTPDIDNASTETLLNLAKDILNNIPDEPQSQSQSIIAAAGELKKLDAEESDLSQKIGLVKKRLSDIDKLKSGLNDYGNSIRKRVERLHISKWLRGISAAPNPCVVCGSESHPNSHVEIEKISKVFEQCEDELTAVAEVPPAFQREEEKLKADLVELMAQKTELQQKIRILSATDEAAMKVLQTRKDMYFFLGHLKASIENFESVSDGSDFAKQIETLQRQRDNLLRLVDTRNVQNRTEAAIQRVGQKILDRLRTLDVEEKYRRVAPRLNVKDLNISVMSTDGNWHPLAEVGSGSNWVSFHISLMCALQEFFLELPFSCVPNFVIFDQPSQVYFPRAVNRRSQEQEQEAPAGNETENGEKEAEADIDNKVEEKVVIADEDKEAVKSMFSTISSSIIQANGGWQGIILDHAGDDIYGEIAGVSEVESWDKERKLIPIEWEDEGQTSHS